jgi:lipid-binding SYLF domain-containing protein
MTGRRHLLLAISLRLVGVVCAVAPAPAGAASATEINEAATSALGRLYAREPRARLLGERARAILLFPSIKPDPIVGGQSGDGVLRMNDEAVEYYNMAAASFGPQAGAQKFSCMLFIMKGSALDYLRKSESWAIGSGPSVVVIDKEEALSATGTTLTQDIYAVPFGQRGLIAGISLEGSKITRVRR